MKKLLCILFILVVAYFTIMSASIFLGIYRDNKLKQCKEAEKANDANLQALMRECKPADGKH